MSQTVQNTINTATKVGSDVSGAVSGTANTFWKGITKGGTVSTPLQAVGAQPFEVGHGAGGSSFNPQAPPAPPSQAAINDAQLGQQLNFEQQQRSYATLFTGGTGVSGQPQVRTASSLLLGS